jgi:hypothetical protein
LPAISNDAGYGNGGKGGVGNLYSGSTVGTAGIVIVRWVYEAP